MTDWEKIADQLIEVIQTADDEERQRLAAMLEAYAEKYPISWQEMKKKPAALSLLVDSMVEGSEARPGIHV